MPVVSVIHVWLYLFIAFTFLTALYFTVRLSGVLSGHCVLGASRMADIVCGVSIAVRIRV